MCAGAKDYQDAGATKAAQVVTLGAPDRDVRARSIAAMEYARGYACSVVLPDGNVLVVGGQPLPIPFTDDEAVLVPGARLDAARFASSLRACWQLAMLQQRTPPLCARGRNRHAAHLPIISTRPSLSSTKAAFVRAYTVGHQTSCAHAELWDRESEAWSSMAPMGAPRTYHSVALLMADGRVFSGGGGLCSQQRNGRVRPLILASLLVADGWMRCSVVDQSQAGQ